MNNAGTNAETMPAPAFVTPSLANVVPERLAEVVRGYREELQMLAERRAYHSCAWALEAIDTLVSEKLRLQRDMEQLRAAAAPRERKHGRQ